jgi:hypothetical protein
LFLERVAPAAFVIAVDIFDKCIRELCLSYGGYEAFQSQDTFILVFSNVLSSVRFCNTLQDQCMHINWNTGLLRYMEAGVVTGPDDQRLYRGFSLKIGHSCGQVEYMSAQNENGTVTNLYYGDAITQSLDLCEKCPGGQTFISHSTYTQIYYLLSTDLGDAIVDSLEPSLSSSNSVEHQGGSIFVMLPVHLRLRRTTEAIHCAELRNIVRDLMHPRHRQCMLPDGTVICVDDSEKKFIKEKIKVDPQTTTTTITTQMSHSNKIRMRSIKHQQNDEKMAKKYFAALKKWFAKPSAAQVQKKDAEDIRKMQMVLDFCFDATTGEFVNRMEEDLVAYLHSQQAQPVNINHRFSSSTVTSHVPPTESLLIPDGGEAFTFPTLSGMATKPAETFAALLQALPSEVGSGLTDQSEIDDECMKPTDTIAIKPSMRRKRSLMGRKKSAGFMDDVPMMSVIMDPSTLTDPRTDTHLMAPIAAATSSSTHAVNDAQVLQSSKLSKADTTMSPSVFPNKMGDGYLYSGI